jgi:transcriptional regulator with XRE-family HTH domain
MGSALSAIVARNIAAERVRRRWTQADLADRLGVTRGAVSTWETGTRVVGLDLLIPLCRALDVPLVDLLKGVDQDDLRALGLGPVPWI